MGRFIAFTAAVIGAAFIFGGDEGDRGYRPSDPDRFERRNQPGGSNARQPRTYTANDLLWNKATRPHKDELVPIVNLIARENSRCASIETYSLSLSGSRSKPGKPVYYVTCKGFDGVLFNVFFERDKESNQQRFAAKQNIPRDRAVMRCRDAVKERATRPHTVDWSILATGYGPHVSGRSDVTSTFTAENAFGIEEKFSIRCLFDGYTLVEANINPAWN